jgi:hypothetical protein
MTCGASSPEQEMTRYDMYGATASEWDAEQPVATVMDDVIRHTFISRA